MARLPRLTLGGYPHHVIQRGNDRRSIFADEADRLHYLATLRDVTAACGLHLHAYVLMPNHAHLLITPAHAGDLGRAMQSLGRRYVRWFNDRHRRVGALFEGRYRSSVVDADHYLLACMRYVELNPVRAKLCERPADFRWSSHRHHVGLAVDPLVTDHQIYWGLGNTPFERQAAYLGLFEHGPGSEELDRIRKSAHGGWLLASPEVAAQIERTVVRPTTERRAGRPRKGT